MATKRIAIIGAGASGMIAAITAARLGAQVSIFERNDRVGKKLLATGNGQCNLTNLNCNSTHYYGENPGFVKEALQCFSVDKTIAFFNSLGALTVSEFDGKVYPRTFQASTILDLLRFEMEKCCVDVKTQTPIFSVRLKNSGFILKSENAQFFSESVIVACGSRAAPQLGGNGSGIEILVNLGHTCTPVYPVLVPIKTDCPFNRHLKGTKVQADISLVIDNKIVAHENGELLFTDYGLSGPPVIQLSIKINDALQRNKNVRCIVDLFPDKKVDELVNHLKERLMAKENVPLDIALIGFVNKRLISSIIAVSGVSDHAKISDKISIDEIKRIAEAVKKWAFSITGSLFWNEAHVCAGGIRTSEFNNATMESNLVKGLYATGEVLDVTGECGGYNLQWAWSSGTLAGQSAAKGM